MEPHRQWYNQENKSIEPEGVPIEEYFYNTGKALGGVFRG